MDGWLERKKVRNGEPPAGAGGCNTAVWNYGYYDAVHYGTVLRHVLIAAGGLPFESCMCMASCALRYYIVLVMYHSGYGGACATEETRDFALVCYTRVRSRVFPYGNASITSWNATL